jgi:hypothetical protein
MVHHMCMKTLNARAHTHDRWYIENNAYIHTLAYMRIHTYTIEPHSPLCFKICLRFDVSPGRAIMTPHTLAVFPAL